MRPREMRDHRDDGCGQIVALSVLAVAAGVLVLRCAAGRRWCTYCLRSTPFWPLYCRCGWSR